MLQYLSRWFDFDAITNHPMASTYWASLNNRICARGEFVDPLVEEQYNALVAEVALQTHHIADSGGDPDTIDWIAIFEKLDNLKNETHSLWVSIISGIHKLMGESNRLCAKNPWSSVWNNIVKSRKKLEKINISFDEVMRYEENNGTWVSSFVIDGEFCIAALQDRIERASYPVCDGNFPWLRLI
ncbi:unnamed protein product [Lactuca virosa]|uniref:Uncharacterized protein n=1 Tax=Lactuca virosa TaxID=75947 RepID=A0AAU9MFQ7_9ASTR|nr:unnamed protein product [Lactuca virosa]